MPPHGPSVRQLTELLEASKLLNSTLDLDTLLDRILQSARELSHADRATLYLVDHAHHELWTTTMAGNRIDSFRLPMGKGVAGGVARTGRISMLADAYRSRRFNRELDRQTGYRTRSLLTVPFRGRDRRVLGVIQVINRQGNRPFGAAERWAIDRLGDYVALALENAMFVKELQDKKRMEDDLVAARRIQVSLLPKELPHDPRYDLAARYVPSLEVGGDCYDAMRLPDGRLGFSLGDICGKGITAALMMANLQALFRLEARRGGDPHVVLSTINRLFHESTQTEHFATFLYGTLDLDTGRVRYCCAGHEPMLVLRADGDEVQMPRGGLPVGILSEFPFETQSLQLAPGDVCVLFSDGITEQTDAEGEEFGRERLRQVVSEARGLPAAEVQRAVEEAVRRFAGDRPPADDFTLLVLKLTGVTGGVTGGVTAGSTGGAVGKGSAGISAEMAPS